jgi:hypothetical protein
MIPPATAPAEPLSPPLELDDENTAVAAVLVNAVVRVVAVPAVVVVAAPSTLVETATK